MPDHAGGMTDARLAELAESTAEKAAEKAIYKVFAKLRIKVDDDASVDAFVDNQKFLTRMRLRHDQVGAEVRGTGLDLVKQGVKALAAAAIVAIGAMLGVHLGTPSALMPLPPIGAHQ